MRISTLKIFTLLAVVTLFFSSCKMSQIGMQNTDTQLQLRPFDLEITDSKTGTAKVTSILGIDFKRLFKIEGANFSENGIATMFEIPVLGAEVVTADQKYALRALIEDNNGMQYDMVMYPKFKQSTTHYIVYSVTETTVIAKLAKLMK